MLKDKWVNHFLLLKIQYYYGVVRHPKCYVLNLK